MWHFLDFYLRCKGPSFNLWGWISTAMTSCPVSARARKGPPSSSSWSSLELKLRRRLRPTHSCLSSPQTWGSLHLPVFTLPAVPQVAWTITWTQSIRFPFSILWTIIEPLVFPPQPILGKPLREYQHAAAKQPSFLSGLGLRLENLTVPANLAMTVLVGWATSRGWAQNANSEAPSTVTAQACAQ